MSASPASPTGPSQQVRSERLDSWKEIAAYLKRGERTVRRWEQTEGLPVHRHLHSKRGTVYALRGELDAWLAARGGESPSETPPVPVRPRKWVAASAGVAAVAAALAWGMLGRPSTPPTPRFQLQALTAALGSETYPAFSADGRLLAYCWNGPSDNANAFDIYVRPVDGQGAARRLHAPVGMNLSPAWSPDGTRIAWFRYEGGDRGKILTAPAGGGPEAEAATALAPSWNYWARLTAWSRDGEWLLFSDAPSPSAPRAIHAVSLRTGERRRLTTPPAGTYGDESPALSPDGRTLAFFRKGAMHRGDLYTVEVDASLRPNGEPLRATRLQSSGLGLAWLPDSQTVLLAASHGFQGGLWRAIPGRPELATLLPVGMEGPQLPAASPSGRLAFVQQVSEIGIWSWPLGAGAKPPQPLMLSTRHDGYPRLSLEGDRIVYMSNRTGSFEVWTAGADGSSPRQITTLGAHTGYASWEPGGRRIVFTSNVGGTYQLYVVSSEGGPPRAITRDPYDNLFPVWSRDGAWIYFSSNRAGAPQIFKMPAAGGPAVQITRGGGLAVRETPDGRTLVYARDSLLSTSLWKVACDGGEETPLVPSQFGWVSWDVTRDGVVYLPFPRRGGEWSVEYMPLTGGPPHRLARLPDLYRLFGLAADPDLRRLIVARLQHQRMDIIGGDPLP